MDGGQKMESRAAAWPDVVGSDVDSLRPQLREMIGQFIEARQLPDSFQHVIGEYYLPLAVWLARQREVDQTLVVGICGGQGSGKSTLTEFLQAVWTEMGLRATGFSLDDIYLTRAERQQLGERVHPLLATRGVPGTHDVSLGLKTIEALCAGRADSDIPIPRFDKSVDDRAPRSEWPHWHGATDILLFEGWCVGAVPWDDAAEPINALEREEDRAGVWRNYVNEQLRGPYRQLFAQLDVLLMLKVPDMDCVLEWRRLQERKLRARSGGGMEDREVERFVQHYERITRNLLREMPGRADCVLELGRDHGIKEVSFNRSAG